MDVEITLSETTNPPPFEIQTATWRDLKALHRLEVTCFDKDAWPIFDLMAVLTFPATVRFKAVVGEEMAGFISGDIRRRQDVGWITSVAVMPAFRQRGIGSALILACEQELGVAKVKLCVRRSNASAQRVYQRMGYSRVDVWKGYYTDGEDAFVYEKQLGGDHIIGEA